MTKPKIITAPERTVERGRGCWNCKHFNNEELARQHYKTKTNQERMAIRARHLPSLERLGSSDGSVQDVARQTAKLMGQGFSEKDAQQIVAAATQRQLRQILRDAQQADARFQVFDRMMQAGHIGICVTGKAPGDFVDHRYLCASWDGATGASVATSGKPLDPLPDELRDIVDSKAKKA